MNDIDRKIQAALRSASAGTTLADEPNLAEELLYAFRGRNRWIAALTVVFSLGFLAIAIWSGLRFYGAEAVREQLLWGGLCMFSVLFISFLKVWMWLEMHSNRVLREVKRVELLLLQRKDEA